jgi:hypothetical protein
MKNKPAYYMTQPIVSKKNNFGNQNKGIWQGGQVAPAKLTHDNCDWMKGKWINDKWSNDDWGKMERYHGKVPFYNHRQNENMPWSIAMRKDNLWRNYNDFSDRNYRCLFQ